MASILKKISNLFPLFPTKEIELAGIGTNNDKDKKEKEKNLSNYISKIKFVRASVDVNAWKEAISEAEDMYLPFRVSMQRIYQDTILNGHVYACMNRRINLTLLKSFKLCDENGGDTEYTKLFQKKWFYDYLFYALQAQAFGYSLISLGDLVNDEFPDISVIRRQNISPDRLEVAQNIYTPIGEKFLEDPYKDWHVWVPTASELGVSTCGYGYLYKVARYEIILKYILAFNMDAAELFGMPIRIGTTNKTNEDERALFERAVATMGSANYIIKDELDKIELLERNNGSTGGHDIYESLEKRSQQYISKIILGHADAIDSIPGKLGNSQGEDNPIHKALKDTQTTDCYFIKHNINSCLIPKMRALGISIPENICFEFDNDEEKEEFRKKQDQSNQATANIFKTIKDAGGKPDWDYFSDRTGINVEEAPEPEPIKPFMQNKELNDKIKNKLNNIYK